MNQYRFLRSYSACRGYIGEPAFQQGLDKRDPFTRNGNGVVVIFVGIHVSGDLLGWWFVRCVNGSALINRRGWSLQNLRKGKKN